MVLCLFICLPDYFSFGNFFLTNRSCRFPDYVCFTVGMHILMTWTRLHCHLDLVTLDDSSCFFVFVWHFIAPLRKTRVSWCQIQPVVKTKKSSPPTHFWLGHINMPPFFLPLHRKTLHILSSENLLHSFSWVVFKLVDFNPLPPPHTQIKHAKKSCSTHNSDIFEIESWNSTFMTSFALWAGEFLLWHMHAHTHACTHKHTQHLEYFSQSLETFQEFYHY